MTGQKDAWDKAKAKDTILQMKHQLNALNDLLVYGNCTDKDSTTYLGLLRHGFEDLATALGQNQYLSDELTEQTSLLRTANARITELESGASENITTDAAIARLEKVQTWFVTWYQLCGFHYASIKESARGFYANFSNETDPKPENPEDRIQVHLGDKGLALRIMDLIPYEFDERYQLHNDSFHDDILDTDNNRALLTKLIEDTFPGAEVTEYKGRTDRDGGERHTLLRMTAYVPYDAVTNWHEQIIAKSRKSTSKAYGRLYVKKAELQSMLQSPLYTKYESLERQKETRTELEKLTALTDMWTNFTKTPVDPERKTLMKAWTATCQPTLGHAHPKVTLFPEGTPVNKIHEWFETEFGFSVEEDFIGTD